MGLRRRMKAARAEFHEGVRMTFQPIFARLGRRLRLGARIRMANRWAAAHPRKLFAIIAGILVVNFVTGTFLFPGYVSRNMAVAEINSFDSVFINRRIIDNSRQDRRRLLEEEVERMQVLRTEIDSLLALPEKTAEDSTRIIKAFNQLEAISTTLTTDEKD